MSKKKDTAAALANILNAKREAEAHPSPAPPAAEPSPPPALPPAAPKRGRNGKSSDKTTFSQYSVYLRKDTRKKVGRALGDDDDGRDFSELVQDLLEAWLDSRT